MQRHFYTHTARTAKGGFNILKLTQNEQYYHRYLNQSIVDISELTRRRNDCLIDKIELDSVKCIRESNIVPWLRPDAEEKRKAQTGRRP